MSQPVFVNREVVPVQVLFLSSFYPPYEIGGYGQLCQEVAAGLKERGHTIAVLTSTFGVKGGGGVIGNGHRLLTLEIDYSLPYGPALQFWIGRRRRERQNLKRFQEIVSQFEPDVVFVWNVRDLPRSLLWHAERLDRARVVYYVAGYWPGLPDNFTAYWQAPARHWCKRWPKKLVGFLALKMLALEGKPPHLRFEHVLCVSAAVRDHLISAGVPLGNTRVIYNGIDLKQFVAQDALLRSNRSDPCLSLLYAGRLTKDKGIHTAIEGLATLVHRRDLRNTRLTIVGAGDPDYEVYLRNLVASRNVSDHVHFAAPVPRERMPELLSQFDVLVFPSRDEALPRIVQEAMASGLVVIGTPVGGTKEILVHDETGLVFTPEDADDLATQIERLVCDPRLRHRLTQAGLQTVVERFNIERMINEIEAYLERVVSGPEARLPSRCQADNRLE